MKSNSTKKENKGETPDIGFDSRTCYERKLLSEQLSSFYAYRSLG
jgi:hypothetical protein